MTTLNLNSPDSHSPRHTRLTRRIARRTHHAVKHSRMVRLVIFLGAIAGSVYLIQALHLREEHATAANGVVFSLSAFLDRGLEVVTDCICDRFFPEGL